MPFFPLLNTEKFKGYCTVHNFSPNNWEVKNCGKSLWAIYSDGEKWLTKKIKWLNPGESYTIRFEDLNISNSSQNQLVVLQLRNVDLKKSLDFLPDHEFNYTKLPEWRSSSGFYYNNIETSYQGEINPFNLKASLLTFHPFIQFGQIKNYLIFVNLEKSPIYRNAKIEIYNSKSRRLIDEVLVTNNHTNIIDLDNYCFESEDLPVFLCRTMAGVPFGLGFNELNPMLSMEHTHPPASFVIHGNRFAVQKHIKKLWFNNFKL
jgi:hypothetical protein